MKFLKHGLWLFALLCLASCGKSKPLAPQEKPTILVSLAPYQFFAQRIAGDALTVETVVPIGANPHVFEPTGRQIMQIGKGAVWFRIGESFENKLLPVLKEKNPKLVDFDLRAKLELIRNHGKSCCAHAADMEDRHIWLSPRLAILQARAIADVLKREFPKNAEIFSKNCESLVFDLETLDYDIKTALASLSSKSFVVSHPAFAYFCKDYGLIQISIEYEGKDPTAKHLAKVMQDIDAAHASLGIAIPQHSNKALEIIAQKSQLKVQTIDPYSFDYFETMRRLCKIIGESSQ